jgi:hypothetical protein
MPGLALQRCFHHEDREAVSRCPNCGRFFCRECVLPHEGRLLCSTCILSLSERATEGERLRRTPSGIGQVVLATLALLVVWMIFYFTGWTLLQLRSSVPVAALIESASKADARVV